MTLFTLRLVARSARWIAPALVYLVWLVLVLANPGPALSNAANMFFGVAVAGCWITMITGNVDDDPHRDLCAAIAGSPAHLQVIRTLAALATTVILAAATSILIASTGHEAHQGVLAVGVAGAALLVSAALIGSTIAAFLHRPVLRNFAWSLILAIAALVGTVLLPPVQQVLRNFNRGQTGDVALLLAVAVATAACSTAASAAVANRRRS